MTNDLRTYLLAQSAISDVVSTRIYPVWLPQNVTYPCITISRVSESHGHNLDSASGYAISRYQIDCWATSYATAYTLADAVRGELSGFAGTMGSTTVDSVVLENESDLHEPPSDGGSRGMYHIACDYIICHQETVPTF